MPRIHQRKTDRGLVPHEQMIAAVEQIQAGDSIRKVAERFGIAKSTLQRNVKKLGNDPQIRLVPNYGHARVFSDQMEVILVQYLIKCSNMYFGLTPKDTRRLAFYYAVKNNCKIPESLNCRKRMAPSFYETTPWSVASNS